MKKIDLNTRLVKLPDQVELTLFLIKQDLKCNKIITGLSKAGFDDSSFRFDSSTLILENVGFTQPSDDVYDFYFKRLDSYTERLDHDAIDELSFNLYLDLIVETRKHTIST